MKRFLSLLLACVMVFAVALTMASCMNLVAKLTLSKSRR